jgi:Lipid A 3-O-deacylase (PagL)
MRTRSLMLVAFLLAFLAEPALSLGQDSPDPPSGVPLQVSKPPDFNNKIYYRNKTEFSLEMGVLPVNIPFLFDFIVGDPFHRTTPLSYTLVPFIASLRWHLDDVRGPWILRGNTDLTSSLSYTAIVRGPETYYGAYIMRLRRNFVQRNWKSVPYFEGRAGLGLTDAKGPHGVVGAQGQDFTFTLMLGSGIRHNFNPRYAMAFGAGYMHISNGSLSRPIRNYGLNVLGPMLEFDTRLGKPK